MINVEDELAILKLPKQLEPFVGDYYKALLKRADQGLLGRSEYLCFKRFIDMYNSGKYIFAEGALKKLFIFLRLLIFIDEDGKPHHLDLYPAQKFVMCGIFGLRNKDGSYVVNRANVFMARRNGKSFLVSALLHALMDMSKFRNELIILASAKGDLAKISFNEFCKFIDNDHFLREQYDNVNRTACWAKHKFTKNKISVFLTGAGAKKTLDGHTNKVCVIDEWALTEPIVTKTLQDGQAHFKDSLLVAISTAQYEIGGDNHKYWLSQRKALYEGELPPNVFLYLCEPDAEDIEGKDFASIRFWGKANPVLLFEKDGYTMKEHIRKKYLQKAREAVTVKGFDLQTFCTKQANIWYSAEDRALCSYDQLKACGTEYSFEDVIKAGYLDWYVGMDLAQVNDLASVNFMTYYNAAEDGKPVPIGEPYAKQRIFTHTISWMPKNKLQQHIEKDKFCYYDYVDKELLLCTAAGGDNIDTNAIYEKIDSIRQEHNLNYVTIAADPYNIAGIEERLTDICQYFILQNQSPKALSQFTESLSQQFKDGIIAYKAGSEDIWEKAITNSVLVRNSTGYYSVEKISLRADSPIRIDPLDAQLTNYLALHIDHNKDIASGDETVEDWLSMF